ncbi:hypothetical protein B7494_g3032 [Chlorociboria aeruginascens]|nr:hypothetical protein B7494_g3032 [Chlorociboria aeruginascens]
MPFLEISSHLGLPPTATYAALNLWNWALLDESEPISSPENIKILHTFTGTRDEEWFLLISVAMEARCAAIIPLMLKAIIATKQGNTEVVIESLQAFARCAIDLGDLLVRMYEQCDPYVFYYQVRPFLSGSKNAHFAGLPRGVFYDEGNGKGEWREYRGGSNAQSSLIQFMDIVLGVVHEATGALKEKNGGNGFLMEMRKYMPRPHAQFLEGIEKSANIRQYVLENTADVALNEAFNYAVDELALFRDRHLRLVTRYIVLPSRNPRPSESSKTSGMNIATASDKIAAKSDSSGPGLYGTGGTQLIPFLKQTRDNDRDSCPVSSLITPVWTSIPVNRIILTSTDGNTQRASIHSSLAMSLAQSANISAVIDDQISDLLLEERRRCFWGIWLLRQLHGEDCRLLEIPDEDQYPNYPNSACQPPCNGKSILPFSGSPLRTEKPDLGIVGYSIQLSDVWFKITKYGRRRSKPSRIPPWSPQSEYATIMAQAMEYETRMAPIHRYKPSDFANRTSEELNANREYWAPWIFVQFLYHTNLCLLNHPLLFSLRLRNITSMIPEIFLQHTDDLIVSHANWIVHLIDVLEAKSFSPSDPFLGHCAAIAATIFLQDSYKPRDVDTNDKEAKFSKCLKFVRGIATYWPHVSRIADNLQKLKDTVSQTYQMNVETPNRRLLIDLGRFWEVLEYPSASERSRDDTHFGASLKGRKINASEILDTIPLPEPVRVNTMHNSGLDDLASASEFAAALNRMDDPAPLYSTDELAVLAESFFQQRDGYTAGGIEGWALDSL